MGRFKLKVWDYGEPIVKAKCEKIEDFDNVIKILKKKVGGKNNGRS